MKYLSSIIYVVIFTIIIIIPTEAQIKSTCNLRKNLVTSNLQGFSFDEENNAIAGFEIYKVTNLDIIQSNAVSCSVDIKTINYSGTMGLQTFNFEKLYNVILTATESHADKDKFEVYLLAKYLYPISKTPENSYAALASVEAYTNAKSYNSDKKIVTSNGCINIVTAEQLEAKYAGLKLNKLNGSFDFVSKGEGFLNNKNSRVYTQINTTYRDNDNMKTESIRPFETEQTMQTKNYFVDPKNVINDIDPNVKIAVAQKFIDGDNYAQYKNFAVMFADQTGKIFSMHEIKKDYLKSINTLKPVYGHDGKMKGVLMILNHYPSFKKALKDPIENNYHIFYADMNGKVIINKDVTYGEADNSRGLSPLLVFERNGVIDILNYNATKILKAFTEVLTIDADGKITKKFNQDQTYQNIGNISNMRLNKSGNQMIVSGEIESPKPTANQTSANFTAAPYLYKSYFVGLWDVDKMELVNKLEFEVDFNIRQNMDIIDSSNDGTIAVLRNELRSYVVKIPSTGPIVFLQPFMNEKNKKIFNSSIRLSNLDIKQYVVDAKNKRIYVITEGVERKSFGINYWYYQY